MQPDVDEVISTPSRSVCQLGGLPEERSRGSNCTECFSVVFEAEAYVGNGHTLAVDNSPWSYSPDKTVAWRKNS